MFDRVACRYDLLNHLLSFWRDRAWRRVLVSTLPRASDTRILDLATGTGDVLLEMGRTESLKIGIDPSEGMISRAQVKCRRIEYSVSLLRSDATRLPFAEASFDAVSVAFGIRNMRDILEPLREAHRVLRVGGRLAVLEFSLPESRWLRYAYMAYFRHVLPRIGGWISGDPDAYRYLNQSVEAFPSPDAFRGLMIRVGFKGVTAKALDGGIVTLYVGER